MRCIFVFNKLRELMQHIYNLADKTMIEQTNVQF